MEAVWKMLSTIVAAIAGTLVKEWLSRLQTKTKTKQKKEADPRDTSFRTRTDQIVSNDSRPSARGEGPFKRSL